MWFCRYFRYFRYFPESSRHEEIYTELSGKYRKNVKYRRDFPQVSYSHPLTATGEKLTSTKYRKVPLSTENHIRKTLICIDLQRVA